MLITDRLMLRRWRDDDREPFAALNADPVVMEHFPSTQTREESDASVDRFEQHFDEHGVGLWAVEVTDGAPFIGFVGLSVVPFDAHFTPAVEVGWRLAREHWGHGYATEGAWAALAIAFDDVGLAAVVSFTAVANRRSRAVMERIGMAHDPADDFDHPRLARDSSILRHVLYRRRRPTR